MFETAELGHRLDKETFVERTKALRIDLLKVQRELASADFPVLIVIGGIDGSGKGAVVNRLFEWMDARGLMSHATDDPTDDERARPAYWRFWMAQPPRGRIGVFLGGWYVTPIERRFAGEIDDDAFGAELQRASAYEKTLVDGGALVIKIWLHVSKSDQRRRLLKLEKSKETRWRVTDGEWKRHKRYARMKMTCEQALRETSTGDAPWLVVEAADARYRDVTVAEHVHERIRDRLASSAPPSVGRPEPADLPNPETILDTLDLSQTITTKRYEAELERWQGRLNDLARRVSSADRGVVMVFEGWDASGKGGAIRRITRALDARYYRVIPIAAPTDEERSYHYLWRFWRQIPRRGRFTLYDRSWYGRVLVERVEGLASERAWHRAYKEINDFEGQLVAHGAIVLKFWLHISTDEQLRRFQEREREPWKEYKIGPEDYRNRQKTNAYEGAASEMISRTSTEYAPWTLIEAEDKHYARVKVLREACLRIAGAL